MGSQLPPEKGHTHPHPILAYVFCGQTVGWMKTPLGKEVDLGSGHIVLDGIQALRERGTAAPRLFGPCLLWPRSPISAAAEMLLIQLRLRQTVSILTLGPFLSKIFSSHGVIWTPIKYMIPFVLPSPRPKRHVEWFNRFAQLTAERPCTLEIAALSPSKLPIPVKDVDLHLTHGFLGPPKSSTETDLDRFSHFCRTHYCDRQTNRPTDRQTTLFGR